MTAASLVAVGLILELENVYHPSLEVLTVKESTVLLMHATPITVLVSAKTPTIFSCSNLILLLVDGVWSDWSDWSECSLTCDGGVQTRSRNCTPPQYNGKQCEGESKENQTCNHKRCPGMTQCCVYRLFL